MKAIILAGGRGERLRPLTCTLPKPLIPFLGGTVLDTSVGLLKKSGISEAAVTAMYLTEKLEEYCSASDFCRCVTEDKPLGTAGAVKNCSDFIDGTFIVISGDCITDINLKDAVDFHRSHGAAATLVLINSRIPTEYGLVHEDDGRITGFTEKPSWSEVDSTLINSGIYIIEPSVLDLIPESQPYDFASDLFPAMLNKGLPLFGYRADCYWCDIGAPEKYLAACRDALDGKCPPEGAMLGTLNGGARVIPPCHIGKGTVINGGTVGPYAVIGENCVIDSSSVSESVLWDGVLCRNAEVTGSVLCAGAVINGRSELRGCAVGEKATVGRFVTLSGARIWNGCAVPDEASFTGDLKFGGSGCLCEAPVQTFSTEALVSMCSAFAAKKHSLMVSGDGTPAAFALSRVAAGACALYTSVIEGEPGSLGQARFGIRSCGCDGGIYINAPGDISVKLFNERGLLLNDKQRRMALRGTASPSPHGIYQKKLSDDYRTWLLNQLRIRPQGKLIALFGDLQSAHHLADILEKCGWSTVLHSGIPRERLILQRGCYFGVSVSPGFYVNGLYDERGVRVPYESFIALRALLCAGTGAKYAVIPSDCSDTCEKYISAFTGVRRALGTDTARVSEDCCLGIMTDAAAFIMSLCRFLSAKRTFLSGAVNNSLPKSVCIAVRCPNERKGEIMDKLSHSPADAQVTVYPDDSLAILRVYAYAMNEEYAAALAMDKAEVIKEMMKHGQS